MKKLETHDHHDAEWLITDGIIEVFVSDGEIEEIYERRASSWHTIPFESLTDEGQRRVKELL